MKGVMLYDNRVFHDYVVKDQITVKSVMYLDSRTSFLTEYAPVLALDTYGVRIRDYSSNTDTGARLMDRWSQVST